MADALDRLLFPDDAQGAVQPMAGAAQAASPGQAAPAPIPRGPDALDRLLGLDGAGGVKVKAADIIDDPSRRLGFVGQAKASFAATDDQWKRIAARQLYPNEPVDQAAKRFQTSSDGRRYHIGPDGKPYEVQARSGMARVLENTGEGVGSAVPVVAGGAAGLVAMPTGPVGSILAAGGGGAAGETARQAIGNWIDPKAGTGEYNQMGLVKEGASGAVGQGIGIGLNRFATRFNPSDIAHYNPQQANQLADTAERLGVRLTPAESTGLASLEAEQKRLMASPRSANSMKQFMEERNREVGDAWQTFLNRIAPARDASALGRQAGQVADDILTSSQTARTNAVNPFYEQTERSIGYINPGQIVQFVEQALPNAKGSERSALQFVRNQLHLTGTDTVDMSVRGMNGLKQAIDTVLENPDLAMKQGLDRTAHRMLQAVREMAINAIENSPADAQGAGRLAYQTGRTLYGNMSERAVTPIQETLAPLLRVNPANSSIVRTAQAMLDPSQRSPEIVARARAMIAPNHPDVWNGMVRQFLQENAVQALQENAKGTVSNAGGNIAKRVGNDLMERNLRAAMTPQQFRDYQDIVDVFRATGRALDANSDTAFKQEAIKRARAQAGGILGRLATAVENVNPLQWPSRGAEFLRNANYERQAEMIANIYTSGNRDAIRALRALRQLSPGDLTRQIVLGHIIERSGEFGAARALEAVE